MVKSLRYDQKGCDNFSSTVGAGRLRRAGCTDSYADRRGYPASDRDAAPHGHTDARIDLPASESCNEVGAARSV